MSNEYDCSIVVVDRLVSQRSNTQCRFQCDDRLLCVLTVFLGGPV